MRNAKLLYNYIVFYTLVIIALEYVFFKENKKILIDVTGIKELAFLTFGIIILLSLANWGMSFMLTIVNNGLDNSNDITLKVIYIKIIYTILALLSIYAIYIFNLSFLELLANKDVLIKINILSMSIFAFCIPSFLISYYKICNRVFKKKVTKYIH